MPTSALPIPPLAVRSRLRARWLAWHGSVLGLGLAAALFASPAVAQAAAQTPANSRQVPTVQAGTPADTPLSEREQATAALVHVGSKTCAMGRSVRIEADAQEPGFFHLSTERQRYRLRPVETSTGAIRLEDRAQGVVWLQLANKSILLNQRQGRRLLDDCANAVQQAVAAAMQRNPGPSLFDVAQRPSTTN